jgi:predicted alpha/beta superfamily hydrolase
MKRNLRVVYPAGKGRIVLRTELDWDKDLEAVSTSKDGTTWTFALEADQPFLYFKSVLIRDGERHWAVGENSLVVMEEDEGRVSYPCFLGPNTGRFSELIEFPSKVLNRTHRIRAYVPPGYDENTLGTYPVAFMQDGQNLFFPSEAYMGSDWGVNRTSELLSSMQAIDDIVIVGIHSEDRMVDYTKPGYEKYAESLAVEVVPAVQKRLRIGDHRRFRSVWGSSLGGVVSFYTVWQYPELFGAAVCMSSTFSHKDDLIDRVLTEPSRDVGFYLDSGWPGDNYEVTMGMAMALVSRGWRYGNNLIHLAFPMERHNEEAWASRLHIPLQFLNGAVARASRRHSPVLGDITRGETSRTLTEPIDNE